MSQETPRTVRRRGKRIEVANVLTLLVLIVNIGVVIKYATGIQSQLDANRVISENNCILIKNAIILSIEQSRTDTPSSRIVASEIERNFQNIKCNGEP